MGALLLIHGYPFDHTLWERVLPLLDRDIQVLAPDLRGFDGKPPGPAVPCVEQLADDLKALLDQRTIARAVVAGMSMGGYVALAFAERYPAVLAGLGLISSQTAADTDEARANRRAMMDKVRQSGPGVAAEASIAKVFAPANSGRAELRKYPETGAQRAGVQGLVFVLEAMARRPDRTALFQSLRVPVLVLHGAHDQFIPLERARELSQKAADAQFVGIANAGHATPVEAPAEVANALNQLVKRSLAPKM